MAIKKRKAIGLLYTTPETFIILERLEDKFIGSQYVRDINRELSAYVFPETGILEIKGDFVFKEWPQPKEIYIYVEENDNETCEK